MVGNACTSICSMSTDTRIPAEPGAPGDGQGRAAPERQGVRRHNMTQSIVKEEKMPRESMTTEAGRKAYDILNSTASRPTQSECNDMYSKMKQLYYTTTDRPGKREVVRMMATFVGLAQDIGCCDFTWKLEVNAFANELGM